MKSGAVIRSGCLDGASARRARSSRQVPSDPRGAVAGASRAEACAESRTGASAAGQRTREDRLISTEALEQLGGVGLEPAGLLDLQRSLERRARRGGLAERHLRLAEPAPRPGVERCQARVDAQVLGSGPRVAELQQRVAGAEVPF